MENMSWFSVHQIQPLNFSTTKGTSLFSVVLLALVDAEYCFTYVDIGCQGRISDGGVYNNSSFFEQLQKGQLKLPPNRRMPSTDIILPYVYIGDSAFALSLRMMKPCAGILEKGCPERAFNYRLSRARRVVENVFGIMASVFRVFRKPMLLEPDKVTNVTLTCVLLHNFLLQGHCTLLQVLLMLTSRVSSSQEHGDKNKVKWHRSKTSRSQQRNQEQLPRPYENHLQITLLPVESCPGKTSTVSTLLREVMEGWRWEFVFIYRYLQCNSLKTNQPLFSSNGTFLLHFTI